MIDQLYDKFLTCESVSTDTRNLPKNCLFVALKGPNFDGNGFAKDALEKGAKYVVVSDPDVVDGDRYILVDDTLKALQLLANHHRKQLNIPVLAITGSNGKTTTKELIHAVLSKAYKCSATKGNLNNHIGVPLTILNTPKDTEILVLEMGANKIGDINELCEIGEPTHGIITNIGKAHLEGFGGYDGVLRAKSELYHFLIQHGGVGFINTRQEELRGMVKRFPKPILYPEQDSFYHCELIDANPFVKYKAENGEEVQTRLMGVYNFDNIATALCIGKFFEVNPKDANEAVANYLPANNRSQIIEKEGNFIILDAYNANPSSMKAAVTNFAQLERPKKILILGDMLELGDEAVDEHHELGRLIAKYDFYRIYLCGTHVIEILTNNEAAVYFESKANLISYLKSKTFDGCSFLIKGSRGMGLEEVIDYIKGKKK